MKRTRTMAYTHAELKRLLPHALEGYSFQVKDNVIECNHDNYLIRINLGPEYESRIASLSMPVCDVTIELHGFDDDAARTFLDRFDRTYRRGGG